MDFWSAFHPTNNRLPLAIAILVAADVELSSLVFFAFSDLIHLF